MQGNPLVVGAVIVDRFDDPRRVLAARRTRPASLVGKWEFPGGKVEDGESPTEALMRELREELGIEVAIHEELAPPVGSTWPASGGFVMRLFVCTIEFGSPDPRDGHDAIQWLSRSELADVSWLESDVLALEHLPI